MESSSEILKWTVIIACVGSGMMAGLFGAFSTFMMKALGSLSDDEGIKAMQAINRLIVRPSFLVVFFGTGILCIVSAILSYGSTQGNASLTMAATAIYLSACIVSTIAFNIPLNNQLDDVEPDSQQGRELWARYLLVWTRWNHLRSLATLVSALLLGSAVGNA
ncbi:MAG: DUF1772 domain-containing protein [bacterium]